MNQVYRDKTSSNLTTVKVQALIDSGINPTIRSRKALAIKMSEEGDKISVHGVEGWFKHVDSNYAIPRRSLHPDFLSYAIPKRRWGAVFSLFDISLKELELSDCLFQEMCFAKAREKTQLKIRENKKGSSFQRVFIIYSSRDIKCISGDLMWLRHMGFNLWWDTKLADDDNWSEATSSIIENASCCVVFCSASMLSSDRCCRELELANRLMNNIIYVKLDDSNIIPKGHENSTTVLTSRQERDYRNVVLNHLNKFVITIKDQIIRNAKDNEKKTLFDKPTIAVLPFANLTGIKEVNYATQGITEDLITLLSRISEFTVVSRFTSNQYAGMLVDFMTVANDLNAEFVLEGSVRKLNDKLRISCRLFETRRKELLWAEKFEGRFETLWDIQDEITTKIVARLQPKVVMSSLDYGSRTQNYEAWCCWQLGWYKLFIDSPDKSLGEALENFHKALEFQPDYALAHAGIANALATGMLWGGVGPKEFDTAKYHAETAFRLLPDNPAVLYAMGMIAFISPAPLNIAMDWLKKALDIEPSNAAYVSSMGYILAQTGNASEGLKISEKALQLCPGDRRLPFINYMLSNTHIAAGNFEKAIEIMLLSDRLKTIDLVWVMVGFAHFKLNSIDESIKAVKECIALKPRSLSLFKYSIHNRLWPQYSATDKDAYIDLCAKVGMK